MTADKLEVVPPPAAEPELPPGRSYFTYTFEDWDGNSYTVRLKGMEWMPLEILDSFVGGGSGNVMAALRWATSSEDFNVICQLPRREIDPILDAWSNAGEVTPGESEASPASSATRRSGRRSKPTSSA